MRTRCLVLIAVMAARMFGEVVPPKPVYWQEPKAETTQKADAAREPKRKSSKKKWIVIGVVAGGAAIGYAVAAKRLGNEGVRIFPGPR